MAAGGRGGSGPANATLCARPDGKSRVRLAGRDCRTSEFPVRRATPPNRRLVPREVLPKPSGGPRSGNDSLTTSSLDEWTRRAPRSATALSTLAAPSALVVESSLRRRRAALRPDESPTHRVATAPQAAPAQLTWLGPIKSQERINAKGRRRMCRPTNPLAPEPRGPHGKGLGLRHPGIGPQTVGEAPLRSLTHER